LAALFPFVLSTNVSGQRRRCRVRSGNAALCHPVQGCSKLVSLAPQLAAFVQQM
jgi:hypothetical protein